MDQWLIRTAQNWIAGPYTCEQIRQMISENKLTLQDEVCVANGYWFSIHERDEVFKYLKIEPPRQNTEGMEDEVTETQTDVQEVHSELKSQSASQNAILSSANRNLRIEIKSQPNQRNIKDFIKSVFKSLGLMVLLTVGLGAIAVILMLKHARMPE